MIVKNKVVIVTGASGGIGEAMAKFLPDSLAIVCDMTKKKTSKNWLIKE